MKSALNILAPTRYPWRFNGPRNSKHNIYNRSFVPFNKLSSKIEGVTVFNPFPIKKFDLIHAFNRIPIGLTPYVIGFESHLPRAFGLEDTAYYKSMTKSLASSRCRAIVAISNYALRRFLKKHENSEHYTALAAKTLVRYPNLDIPPFSETSPTSLKDGLKLVFVGNHFGRKGGLVAIRLAELAQKNGFPLSIDIVSSLEVGTQSWVGPTRLGYWEDRLKLLHNHPNIRFHGTLPNTEVLSLITNSHFLLLPTFSDTFGFTVIEAMAVSVPSITTNQCALPEFIESNQNGFLLDIELDNMGEWKQIHNYDRSSKSYEEMFTSENDHLAVRAFEKLKPFLSNFQSYQDIRYKAHSTATNLFCASDATRFWDNLYSKALSE